MRHFTAIEKATGRTLFNGESDLPELMETPERAILLGVRYDGGYVVDGVFHPLPEQPSRNHVFDYVLKQWVDPRTIEQAREQKWQDVKFARELREFGTFVWDGSSFDCDQLSAQRIQGAAQLATLAKIGQTPFEIDWTLADNTVRSLSADDMIAVGQAMGVHINTLHGMSRLKREAINAAQTVAEVDAIPPWYT